MSSNRQIMYKFFNNKKNSNNLVTLYVIYGCTCVKNNGKFKQICGFQKIITSEIKRY